MSAVKNLNDKLIGLFAFLLRSFSIALAIVAVGSYIVISPPVLTTVFPGLILFPPKNGPEYNVTSINGSPVQDVYFGANGVKLHGWFLQSKNANSKAKDKVLIFCHGNGCNVPQCLLSIERWLKTGVSVFAFDYEGYGKSSGKPRMNAALNDGEMAFEYLVSQRKIAAENIILYGQSFGAAVACDLAKTRSSSGALIVESGFSTLISTGRKKVSFFNYYPECLTPIPALDNGAVLQAKHPPLLLIHGTQDPVIPFSEAEHNFAIASEPKQRLTLPHSSHWVDDADLDLYQKTITTFVAKLCSSGASGASVASANSPLEIRSSSILKMELASAY